QAKTVLSVSPQKWLTEGDPVTLICEVKGSSTGWTFSWYTLTASSVAIYYLQLAHISSVSEAGAILESPVHPVMEGDSLTLRCLYKHSTPANPRADFYKDGSLIQSQTTEMIISTVSKSHEGFYYCKHPKRGESPKSWISVRGVSNESCCICELIYFFICSRSDIVLDKVFVCLFFSVSFRISDLCPPHTQFCTDSLSVSASDSRADLQMLQDERYNS
ncbi:hypothetical protein cypCar_00029309, partial [Cyprinus carpio]